MNPNREKSLKEQTVSGVIWSFLERVLAQGVSFIVSIVLARILMPEEYGLIAIVMVVINICNVFFNSGFSTSLIQKKDADELDFSTAFWSSLLLAIVLYAAVYLLANPIAVFYKQELLKPVIRVMGLSLIVSSLKAIQKAYVSRKMQFRKFFWATLGGTLASAMVGIWMAVAGYGVWALAAQYLTNALIDTIVLGLSIEWHPHWMFSKERLKGIIAFGGKVLAASLIYTIYEDLRTLIIGKVYSSDDLAYYNKGKQLPGFVVNNINSAISSALLPAMSKLQGDKEQMKNAMRNFNKMGAFIMMPMMVGLAVVAKPLVMVLLTEKWLFCVPYLRLMCIYYAFMPMQEANTQAVLAAGRSDIALKAEILKRGVNLAIIAGTFWISVEALVIGELVAMAFSLIVNMAISDKLFQYGVLLQLKDIMVYVIVSIVMGVCVAGVSLFIHNIYVSFATSIILGILVYSGIMWWKKDASFVMVVHMVGNNRA